MKKTSISKRVLAVLLTVVLFCSCAVTAFAGEMSPFNGDDGSGKQAITLTTNAGKILYEMGPYSGSTRNTYVGQPDVGMFIKLTATDNATRTFMFWYDEYAARIYSYDRVVTFTVASNMYLRAVYANVSATQHFVAYISYGGNRLQDAMYDNGATVAQPSAPTVPGFTFTGWTMTPEEIAKSDEDIFVYPTYSVNKETYTVKLTNSAYVSGAGTYSAFQTVTVQAEPKNGEGKAFSYWKDAAGNVVSYDRVYEFRINYNATFTAVYGEEVTAQPVIRVSKIVRDTADFKVTFYAERSVPSEYTVVSHGMLMSTTAKTKAAMTVAAAGFASTAAVRKAYGKSNENCGTFSLAKADVGSSTKVYVRPFIIVKDAAGKQSIVYGDMMASSGEKVTE